MLTDCWPGWALSNGCPNSPDHPSSVLGERSLLPRGYDFSALLSLAMWSEKGHREESEVAVWGIPGWAFLVFCKLRNTCGQAYSTWVQKRKGVRFTLLLPLSLSSVTRCLLRTPRLLLNEDPKRVLSSPLSHSHKPPAAEAGV